MANILILVAPLDRHQFTGGSWCILRHAVGLAERGHHVAAMPILPCAVPRWWDPRVEFMRPGLARAWAGWVREACRSRTRLRRRALEVVASTLRCSAIGGWRYWPASARYGATWDYSRLCRRHWDAVVATSFPTALPAKLVSSDRTFYFAQHYEPFFRDESDDPALAEEHASLSYRLGLSLIANSSWLRNKLAAELPGTRVDLCTNGIDTAVFRGTPKTRAHARAPFVVISYGGRNATWKGFADMAEGVRRFRQRHPEIELVWKVFGAALLPPNNDIAPYEALGFLEGEQLAQAYRSADVLLSASWYESFPLFPLEAMACGLPVITTQPGTEEYASQGITAEIVEPRDPEAIAGALARIENDHQYAERIACEGHRRSQQFSWSLMAGNMEPILLPSSGAPTCPPTAQAPAVVGERTKEYPFAPRQG